MPTYNDIKLSSRFLSWKERIALFKLGSNGAAAPDVYLGHKNQVRQYPGDWNLRGFVLPDDPTTMYVASGSNTAMPHEAAHLQQLQAGQRSVNYNVDKIRNNINKVDPVSNSTDRNSANFSSHHMRDSREFLAELQKRDANSPQGQSVWNDPGVSKMIPSEDDRHYLDQLLLPTLSHVYDDKYTSIRPTTLPSSLDWLDKIRRTINNYTKY